MGMETIGNHDELEVTVVAYKLENTVHVTTYGAGEQFQDLDQQDQGRSSALFRDSLVVDLSTPCLVLQCTRTVRTHGYLAVGGCGIPVVVLTLVGNRSFGCHGQELDSRADDILRPVIRVQAWRRECLKLANTEPSSPRRARALPTP